MEISTKELRIQLGKILAQLVNGQEITLTFHGKTLAKIISPKKSVPAKQKNSAKYQSTNQRNRQGL